MATLDEIRRAGLEVTPGSGSDQVLAGISGALQGGYQGYQQGQQEKIQSQKDQVSMYTALREAGYTSEEASSKVSAAHSSIFSHDNFQAPTNDVFKTKAEKGAAELKKIQAETDKITAETTAKQHLDEALAKGAVATYDAAGNVTGYTFGNKFTTVKQPGASGGSSGRPMTPSEAYKVLSDPVTFPDPAEQAAAHAVVRAKLGIAAPDTTAPAGQPQTSEQKIKVRQKASGKTGTINVSDFDPNKYEKI